MLARRQLIRGLGLVAVGSFVPVSLRAGPPFIAPPPHDFASNRNYFIYGGGAPIRGLKVTIDFADDLVAPTGLNMQLNAYSPDGANCVYQQYCMGMSPKHEGRLGWSNENFPSQAWRWKLYGEHHHDCDGKSPAEDTCKGDIFNVDTGEVGHFPGAANRVPAGARLTWELANGPNGSITGATYSLTYRGQTASTGPQMIDTFPFHGSTDKVGPKSMAPILAFQMNIVALNDSKHADFSGGAGTITYEAATTLTPCGQAPAGLAVPGTHTGESSNVTYAQLPTAPSRKIAQGFGTPYAGPPTCPPQMTYNAALRACELNGQPLLR